MPFILSTQKVLYDISKDFKGEHHYFNTNANCTYSYIYYKTNIALLLLLLVVMWF